MHWLFGKLPRFSGRFLVGLALVLFGWLGSSALAAWQLVSRPAPPQAESQPEWLQAESVRIETRDGEELGTWFQAGEPGRSVVLFLHGMGGSRTTLADAARRAAARGNGFLALSLRSFGDSTGDQLDFGWSARADVVAAVDYIEAMSPGKPVVVVGQSLGAAAAIFAAPELENRVAGYVLEAPYRDLEKACRDRLAKHLASPLDELAFAGLRLWAPLFLSVDVDLVRPIDYVERFPEGIPVLFVAGSFDREAPVEDVRSLTERCSADAELVVLDGRDHRDLWAVDERHWALWVSFLERVENGRAALDSH